MQVFTGMNSNNNNNTPTTGSLQNQVFVHASESLYLALSIFPPAFPQQIVTSSVQINVLNAEFSSQLLMAVNLPLTLRRKPEKDRREDRGVFFNN